MVARSGTNIARTSTQDEVVGVSSSNVRRKRLGSASRTPSTETITIMGV